MSMKSRIGLAAMLVVGAMWLRPALGLPIPVEDLTTQGTWVGTYGADGYILPAFYNSSSDVVSLPSYVSGWVWSPSISRWNWATGQSDPRAVTPPDGNPTNRSAGCFYDGGGAVRSLTVNLNQAKDFKLGVYVLDWDSTSRTERLSVPGYEDVNVSGFNPGKWYIYDVSGGPGTPVTLTMTHTGGANTVMSAVMFDPGPPPPAGLTWDGTVNNWGSAHWTGANPPPPPDWPDATINATVGAGTVTVEANHAAYDLTMTGGTLAIGAGNSLAVTNEVNASGGLLTLGAGSAFSTAKGSIADLTTLGSAAVGVTGTTLSVDHLQLAAGSTLTKQGSGKLALNNTASVVAPGATFAVLGGTLSSVGANPLGTGASAAAEVVLDGGTLEVSGAVSALPNILRERLFDYDGTVYLNPIDSGSGYLTQTNYLYEGSLTSALAFNGDHWQNAPGNFGAMGLNGWDNIGGLWFGQMTIGGSSPLPASTNITLGTGSDDGSVWWVDLNGNGVFESGAGELIVNNNYYQGTTWRYGTLNVPAGSYNMAIGFYEGGGGEWMQASYAFGGNPAVTVNPGAGGQANIWSALGYGGIDMTSTNVTVLSTSTINAVTDVSAAFGSLVISGGATLNTRGGPTTFSDLSFAGPAGRAVGVSNINAVTIPTFTDGGVETHFTKSGPGTLTLPSISAADASSFTVNAGTLKAQGATPLGAADTLVLGGGTFDVSGVTTYTAGLKGGSIFGVWGTAPNPGNFGVTLGPQGMLRNDALRDAHWRAPRGDGSGNGPDNTTLIYTGQIYLSGTTSFVEQCDDTTNLVINGVTILYDGGWDNATSGQYTPPAAGWYPFEVRFSNGGGGYGFFNQQNRSENWNTATFGFGYFLGPNPGTNASFYTYLQDPGNASFLRAANVAAIDMSGTDVLVTPGTTGSRINATTDTQATFRNLTVGAGSDLTLSGARINFASAAFGANTTLVLNMPSSNLGPTTTGGNLNIRGTGTATASAYNDQGIPSLVRVYESATLALDTSGGGSVVAGATNFRLEAAWGGGTFGTLRATGALPLGAAGNTRVTLVGGTLNLFPVPANANLVMPGTDISVLSSPASLANASTVRANTTGSAQLGNLSFDGQGVLTTAGASAGMSFFDTTITTLGDVAFNTTTTTYPGSVNGGGLQTVVHKRGSADMVLNAPGINLGNTSFQTEAGRLVSVGSAPVAGAAALNITKGELVLASSDGNDVTYTNAIRSTASGTLTAGSGGYGVAGGAVVVNDLLPLGGSIITMRVTDADCLLLPNGVGTAGLSANNALSHYGFNRYPGDQAMMNLHLNAAASMMSGGVPATHANLTGHTLLTTGPQGRGLNYDVDEDFMAAVNVPANEYCNLWVGKLTVTPATAGLWHFRDSDRDDWSGIWIDLNQNGVFESNGALNSNQGEQLAWNDQGDKTATLAAGQYLVAFTHLEGGGGSRMQFSYRSPLMGAEAVINPADPSQAGFWSAVFAQGGLDISQGEVRTLDALNLGTLILGSGGLLNRASPGPAQRDITVTQRLVVGQDLDMTHGETLTTVGADVTINSGSTLFINHPVNARNLNVQGNLVRTGIGGQADVTVTQSLTLNSDMDFTPSGGLASAGADINIGPSGRLVVTSPLVANNVNTAGILTMPGANITNSLNITGGTTTTTGNVALGVALTGGGGTLATAGDLTVSAGTSMAYSGQINVTAGHLILDVGGGQLMPGGRALHLDASALVGYSNGQTVASWTDTSGAGHHANVLTSDPAYTTGVLNGLPVVRFDNDDRLNTTYNFDPLTSYTVFSVARYTGGDSERIISSGTRNWLFGFHGDGIERWYAEGWIVNNQVQGGNTQWQIHAGTIGPGPNPPASFWRNGTLVTSNNYGSGDTNYMIGTLQLNGYVGANEVSNADIAEVIIFDRVLTASELNSIGGFLGGKYGISTTWTGTLAPSVGDIRLAPGTQVTITGAGNPLVNSATVIGGPGASGGYTLGGARNLQASAAGDTLTFNATSVNANSFNVTGPGTVALTQNLTLGTGTLGVASGATLAAQNTLTIDARSASFSMADGRLRVASGTLDFYLPGGGTMPAGRQLHLDAGAISGLSNGQTVAQWLDISGQNHHTTAIQSDPAYFGNVLNGRPVVRFDGDDGFYLGNLASSFPSAASLFIVTTLSNDNGYNLFTTMNNDTWWRWDGNGNSYPGPFRASRINDYTTNMPNSGSHVFELRSSASGWEMFIDGVSRGAAGANYSAGGDYRIAMPDDSQGSKYLVGDIAEIIAFDSQLTATQRQAIGGFLAGKYGISSTYTGTLGIPALGNLVLGPATTLNLSDGVTPGNRSASFASMTTEGPTAAIQGSVTLAGPMTLGASPGTLFVTGSFTMAAGSTYNWEHDGVSQDLVAVTGTVDVSSSWNLGITLGAVLPDGQYNLFTHTGGSAPPVGPVNIVKENAYARLITSATVGSDATRVFVDLDLADVTTWTSNSGNIPPGTTAWNVATNWTPGAVPTASTPTIVQAPTANQIATVTSAMGTQAAQSLIIDNGGHVLIQPGGDLQVSTDADVLPTGSLTVNGRLGVGTTVVNTFTPLNLPSGLISYWPFDEGAGGTTANLVGGGPTGTLSNTTWVAGKEGNALSFNGSSSSVETNAYPLNAMPAFTMAGWVRATAGGNRIGLYGQNDLIEAGFDGGQVTWWTNSGSYQQAPYPEGGSFPWADWHHLVYIADSSGHRIYIDGTQVATNATVPSGGSSGGTNYFRIGGNGIWDGPGANWFNGQIDDVALWTRALTPAELQLLYTGTTITQIGGTLTTAGTTVFGEDAILDIPRIDVIGGTVQGGKLWPPSARATLQPQTTMRLAGGQLLGGFTLTNPSTTPGSYALEVENGAGIQTAHLIGPNASMRKTTAGAATFSGEVILNNIRVEDGSLTFAHGPQLLANNITVTGGSLTSHKNTTVGTLDLQGGTTTLTRHTTVTTAFQGSAMLIADGSFDLDLRSARANFGGTLRVANSVPATSGNLTVILPTGGSPPPGNVAFYNFNDGTANDSGPFGYNGAFMGNAQAVGGALVLDGAGDFVNLPSMASQFTNAGTVLAWVKLTNATPTDGSRTGFMGFGGTGNCHYTWTDGQAYITTLRADGNRVNNIVPSGAINRADWHMVAITSDPAGGWNMYQNTTLLRNTPAVWGINNWTIGKDVANFYLDGQMDSVMVFNRALTPAELASLYGLGRDPAFMPSLGNLRLDPDSQITLTGEEGIARFSSVGATGGLTIGGGLTLGPNASGPANVRGTSTGGGHFNADIAASSFNVTGPGTVSLGRDTVLNIAAGGTLSVPAGVTLSGRAGVGGTATINASQAGVSFDGTLDVASGTLVLNAPAGGSPQGASVYYSFNNLSGSTVVNDGTLGASGNGTLTNGAGIAAGRIGNGMTVADGSSQYLNVPGTGLPLGTEWSIAAWFRDLHGTDNWRTMTRRTGGGDDHQIIVQSGQNNLGLYDNTRGGGFMDSGGDLLPFNGWHHIAAVGRANDTTDYYVDGVLVGTVNRRSTSAINWIGNDGAGWGQTFANVLDEFVVYNRPLTPGEIQYLYNAGLNGDYGPVRMGNLTMAPGTRLVSTAAPVGFSTATIGGGTPASPTTMTGDFTIDRRIAVSGTGHLIVNGPTGNDGDLRFSNGAVYEWSFASPTNHDLIEVLGDLHFGGSFTLSIIGEGSSIAPTDWIPIFLYTGILDAPGGLDYTIEIGNLADPRHLYLWDTTGAQLSVGLREGQQGIWLHGLIAQAIPEPGTLSVLALGALALLRRRRRKS